MARRILTTAGRCPVDDAPAAMDTCQGCRFFRGAASSPHEAHGWAISCNWPRSGAFVAALRKNGMPPLDPVRIYLTWVNGQTEYEPPHTHRPMDRWYAEWLVGTKIVSGFYQSARALAAGQPARRVYKSIIVSA